MTQAIKTANIGGVMPSVALLLLLWGSATAWADVRLSPLFSAGAVLQRDRAVPVWGTADVGEAVTVAIHGVSAQAIADHSGHWTLKLPALKAGGPWDLTVNGKNQLVVHDVAIGEVWFASGQSNMAFPLATFTPDDPVYGPKARQMIAAVNDPLLRMFNVTLNRSPHTVLDNVNGLKGAWKAAAPESAGQFSAVAYHYAHALRQKLQVPVGIINASWGGTGAEAWTSREALKSDPLLQAIMEGWDKALEEYPAKHKLREEEIATWKKAVAAAKGQGKAAPKLLGGNPRGPESQNRPATLFNAMVAPAMPYGIKGVIWYQGEANGAQGPLYRVLFPTLIRDWRSHWNEGDFPFLFVQLANYMGLQTLPSENGFNPFAPIREAQMLTLAAVPNTGMASAIDLADPENPGEIHCHNKEEVGRRLALIAFATVYGQKVASYSGPLYSSLKIVGGKARVSFTHTDRGLVAKGDKLQGFALAGQDGHFVWGDATIDGNEVVVTSAQVSSPVAVRYGWAMNPIGNLYNQAGLPASPFRTDTEGLNGIAR